MIAAQRFGGPDESDLLQKEIEARGLEIFACMKGARPGVFTSVNGWLMSWSMGSPALKTQLFRFIDVLATLESSREIVRHAREYLGGEDSGLPGGMRLLVRAM